MIVSGQTGAGKTAVTRMVKDALDRNGPAAWINMDFYNPHHPEYARWQGERPQEADALVRPDGDLWWEQAQEYALARGFSILLESAMVTPAECEDICRRIQSATLPAGVAPYRIGTAFVAVAGPTSRFDIMGRHLDELQQRGHGRLVDPDIHDAALRGVLRGAAALEREGLGDYAAVLRRDGHTVHAQTIAAGQSVPEDQLTLVAAIEREHARVQNTAEAAQFAARHAAATVMAPAFALPELDHIARSAAPLLPPPHEPWREAAARAVQLRGVFPAAAPDPTLTARTDADVVQLLAHALADRHTLLAAGNTQAKATPKAAVERLLGELARRASLSPEQRAWEQQHRQVLRAADHRTISEPGSALPSRPSAAAARSRSTTATRPPGATTSGPSPTGRTQPGDGSGQRRGRSR